MAGSTVSLRRWSICARPAAGQAALSDISSQEKPMGAAIEAEGGGAPKALFPSDHMGLGSTTGPVPATSRMVEAETAEILGSSSHQIGWGWSNRLMLKSERSRQLDPFVVRSASISPITLANLKPCPEHGEATTTSGAPGRVSMTKC